MTTITERGLPPDSKTYSKEKQAELSELISTVLATTSSGEEEMEGTYRLAYTTTPLGLPAGASFILTFSGAELLNTIKFDKGWISQFVQSGVVLASPSSQVPYEGDGFYVTLFGKEFKLGNGKGGIVDVIWKGDRIMVEERDGGYNIFLKEKG